jgi:hypothetical protein
VARDDMKKKKKVVICFELSSIVSEIEAFNILIVL